MKNKDFKMSLGILGYGCRVVNKGRSSKHTKLLVYEPHSKEVVGWIFLNKQFSLRLLKEDVELFRLMTTLASTPLEEREEPKKYIYTLPISRDKTYKIMKPFGREPLSIDSSDLSRVRISSSFHFTDAEIESYPEDIQALFKACNKEEVK
ncbi:MAG: hypothetical protein L0I88_01315 [Alkalibacterium sp.]|nr:hypothetical protein [Alkalibacterium sp.]